MRQAKIGRKNPNAGNRGRTGEAHYNWKGGITPVKKSIRESRKYERWRQDCFKRDLFKCQKCGSKGGRLNVHHKKTFSKLLREAVKHSPLFPVYEAAMIYFPLWDIQNGITLCEECHKSSKHRFKKWKLAV